MKQIFNIINTYIDTYYDTGLNDIKKLALEGLNIQLISRNTNNNIHLLINILKYTWNIDITQFTNINVNNDFDKYLKNNLKYTNKKPDDIMNMYEYNLNTKDIRNTKILFIDFRKFKFTEQKYYVLYIEYLINLHTLNKIHYILIINNFDYILSEYIKSIIYFIEKNGIQIIILTSNNNIYNSIKGFFIKKHTTIFNFNNNNNNINNLHKIINEVTNTNYSILCNKDYLLIAELYNNDIFKVIINKVLYEQFINDYNSKHNTDINLFIDKDLLDIYKLNLFLQKYINTNFIIIKYSMMFIDNLIIYKAILFYINNNKTNKTNITKLYNEFKKISKNIRNISYLLTCHFLTIEECIQVIYKCILFKKHIINELINYFKSNQNILKSNDILIYIINTILINIKIANPVYKIIFNNSNNYILNNLEHIYKYLNNFVIILNIETKNKYINNKFNKLLFILNNNKML